MTKTNWQNPGTSEIRSTHISGLQEAVGKLEDSIGLDTVHETNIPLTEVFISNDDRCRIYQAPEGKRNWLLSPTPLIKKNGTIITDDFEIDYGGGAIIFTSPISEKDTVTVDVTYTTNKGSLVETVNEQVSKIKYSPSITTSDNVISLPDNTTKGQINMNIKGETITNLLGEGFKNPDNWISAQFTYMDNGYAKFTAIDDSVNAMYKNTGILKPSTVYTIYADVRKNTTDGKFMTSTFNAGDAFTSETSIDAGETGIFKFKVVSKDNLTDKKLLRSFLSSSATQGEIELRLMILEGNYTNKDINYIEGTKSTIGSNKITSVGKNLFNSNKFVGEDVSYLTAKKEDKIVNLRKINDEIYDEIRQNENGEMEAIIRTTSLVLDGSEQWRGRKRWSDGSLVNTTYCDIPYKSTGINEIICDKFPVLPSIESVDEIEDYGICIKRGNNRIIYLTLPPEPYGGVASKVLSKNPVTLIYPLAEPEIIPLRWTGLNVEKNGTLYFDTIIPEIGFYYDNGLYSHAVNHPIEKVDTLYKVNKQTGIRTPLDTSKCEFREDRLSFTHPDLKDGDLCDWDYVSEGQYPNTEKTIIVPTNLKSSVDSLLKDSQIQKENIRQFDSRLNGLATNIEENYVRFPCYVEKVTIGKTSSDNPMVSLYLPNDVKGYKEGQRFTFKMPTDIEGDGIYIGFAGARYRYCYRIRNQDYESVTKLYKKITYTATYNGDAFIIQGAESKDMTRDSINVQFSQTNEIGELDENDRGGLYTVLLCGSRGWTDDINTFPIGSAIVLTLKHGLVMDITNDKIKIVINNHDFSFLKKPNGSFVTKLYKDGVYTFRWNGENFILQGGENINFYKKTYAELKVLKKENELVEGKKYLLTDYQTKYKQSMTNITKTMEIEELVLTASSVNTFKPIAYSSTFPQDIIYYDFNDNVCEDKKTPRNGFITYRIDTVNNLHCPQDWRTMLWYCSGGEHKTFGNNCHDIYIGTTNGLHENIFGNNCSYISFGNNCSYNSFGNNCFYDILENDCDGNSFKDYCSYNSFGNNCENNSFGSGCNHNSFGNSCDDNSFNENCTNNSLVNSCSGNTFGDGCNSNNLVNSCDDNTFGNDCNNLFVKKLRNKDISNISELKNESCTVNIERNSNKNYIYWYFDSNNNISTHEIP